MRDGESVTNEADEQRIPLDPNGAEEAGFVRVADPGGVGWHLAGGEYADDAVIDYLIAHGGGEDHVWRFVLTVPVRVEGNELVIGRPRVERKS